MIQGYRQPRMFPVSDTELERMGYVYNSSLNPAFIPGRYMHLSEPRTCFMTGKLLQIPASVTPWIRFRYSGCLVIICRCGCINSW